MSLDGGKGRMWADFFDRHAPVYMQNVFVGNTFAEVDFVIEELGLASGARILDIGCGTGRHSVELARRGYRVTGVDVSEGMLTEARKAAEAAGVIVEWIHEDATRFRVGAPFDGAICLCEGAFALVNDGEDPVAHDVAILGNIRRALRPGAPLVMTTLNAMRSIREVTQEDVDEGRFDPRTLTRWVSCDVESPEGTETFTCRERSYVATELERLLSDMGFEVRHIWGGTAGNWGRRPIDLDEFEIMAVARKRAGE